MKLKFIHVSWLRIGRQAGWMVLGLFMVSVSHGQSLILEGKCRDVNQRTLIPYVNFYVPALGVGTVSDIYGKYVLQLQTADTSLSVVLSHIGYEKKTVTIGALLQNPDVDLRSRLIQFNEVEVVGRRESGLTVKDIPLAIAVMPVRQFEVKGFLDTGDILSTDHSIQTTELVSGRKTISLRGGNPDDVTIIHHGLRLNGNLTWQADVSTIDLADVEQLEIIKGALTSSYSPDAFSGVINIVPRKHRDYSVKFRQLLGPERNGDWTFQLHRTSGPWYGSVSAGMGAYRREYESDKVVYQLQNSDQVYSGMAGYENPDGVVKDVSVFTQTGSNKYENERSGEVVATRLNLLSLSMETAGLGFDRVGLMAGYWYQTDEQKMKVANQVTERLVDDQSLQATLTVTRPFGGLFLDGVLQMEKAWLQTSDNLQSPPGFVTYSQKVAIGRQGIGTAVIIRYPFEQPADWIHMADISASFRYDHVRDDLDPETKGTNEDKLNKSLSRTWNAGVLKLSSSFEGARGHHYMKGYLNFGRTVKFPRLLYQISLPFEKPDEDPVTHLEPEEIQGMDAGFLIAREYPDNDRYSGWQLQSSFFRTYYQNKFRNLADPSSPVLLFDNVDLAEITGTDQTLSLFFFRNRLSVDLGLSLYDISEKAAFPFKSDLKQTVALTWTQSGYQVQGRWFYENEQTAWVRNAGTGFETIELPPYNNMDLHASKQLEWNDFRGTVGLSARNILNRPETFETLILRDRRFYIIFTVQY
ncbi:MAG: TonB-dependent receptor plug domain-containing protein [Bacteroidetes bacterium]|nr:TonB-dependent receptor plug domain-containing protein [Bacteroidota bacterium]